VTGGGGRFEVPIFSDKVLEIDTRGLCGALPKEHPAETWLAPVRLLGTIFQSQNRDAERFPDFQTGCQVLGIGVIPLADESDAQSSERVPRL
jgi:hypothetical protein